MKIRNLKVSLVLGMEDIKVFRIEQKENREYKERLKRTKLYSQETCSDEMPF